MIKGLGPEQTTKDNQPLYYWHQKNALLQVRPEEPTATCAADAVAVVQMASSILPAFETGLVTGDWVSKHSQHVLSHAL